VSESDYSRKHALECMRLAADSMQLAGTFRTPLCSRISCGWRGYGPTAQFEDRMGILGWKAHTRTQSRNKQSPLALTRTSRQ
jgi:hypothetical protein